MPVVIWSRYGRGTGRNKRDGSMNRLETAFAEELEARKVAGEILWWRFEGLTFRLAKKTSYTPDFVVQLPDGEIVLYELKGRWLQAARVKIKTAADLFPFRFIGVMRKRKGDPWTLENF